MQSYNHVFHNVINRVRFLDIRKLLHRKLDVSEISWSLTNFICDFKIAIECFSTVLFLAVACSRFRL